MQFLISITRKSDSSLKITIDLELVNNSNYQKYWSYLSKFLLLQGSCDYTVSFFWKLHSFSFIQNVHLFILWRQVLSYIEPKGLHCFLFICAGENHLYFFHLLLFFFFSRDHLSPWQGCYPGNFLSSNRRSFYLKLLLFYILMHILVTRLSFHKQLWWVT